MKDDKQKKAGKDEGTGKEVKGAHMKYRSPEGQLIVRTSQSKNYLTNQSLQLYCDTSSAAPWEEPNTNNADIVLILLA